MASVGQDGARGTSIWHKLHRFTYVDAILWALRILVIGAG